MNKNPILKTKEGESVLDGTTMREDLQELHKEIIENIPTISINKHLPPAKATLWRSTYLLHSDIDNLLHSYAHGQKLQDYIIDRANWNINTFHKVNWQAFHCFYKKQ